MNKNIKVIIIIFLTNLFLYIIYIIIKFKKSYMIIYFILVIIYELNEL